jgi:hypothetical protein
MTTLFVPARRRSAETRAALALGATITPEPTISLFESIMEKNQGCGVLLVDEVAREPSDGVRGEFCFMLGLPSLVRMGWGVGILYGLGQRMGP